VSNILEKEALAGIPYSRMVLAGFSQGGALSLVTGLQVIMGLFILIIWSLGLLCSIYIDFMPGLH
jgi:predicted esterase